MSEADKHSEEITEVMLSIADGESALQAGLDELNTLRAANLPADRAFLRLHQLHQLQDRRRAVLLALLLRREAL